MAYKVIHNKKVIDVLPKLTYVKYQLKHNILLLCDETEAQGILSSDGSTAYHISTLLPFPVDNFLNVSLEEITSQEYERLKAFHLKTPEEGAEAVLLDLMERGIL